MSNQPIPVWSGREQWQLVSAEDVASGSQAQAANILEMAIQDIAALYEALDANGNSDLVKRPSDTTLRFRKRRFGS